jgi:hypothetical protein
MSKRGQSQSSEGLLDVACPAAKRLVSAPALAVAADGLVLPALPDTRQGAQHFIRETVAALLLHKTEPDFPVQCVSTVLRDLLPVLDSPVNRHDRLLIRAETGDGRNLNHVMVIAMACGRDGLAVLQAERSEFDKERGNPTRNWISWVKKVKASKTMSSVFSNLSAAHWSTARAAIMYQATATEVVSSEPELGEDGGSAEAEQDDDDIQEPCCGSHEMRVELRDDVVECFQNHDDAVDISLALFPDYAQTCDSCAIDSSASPSAFYSCAGCVRTYCACCEERRIHFK